MSQVQALGYIGFGVSDVEAWVRFATGFLGMQAVPRADGTVDLRMDSYSSRIRLHPDGSDDVAYLGWEVSDRAALDALAQRLRAAGTDVTEGSRKAADDRRVEALISFADLDGILCEAYFGPLQKTQDPFVSPIGVRFKTGRQGLGHVVLNTMQQDAAVAWYQNVLGFKISDYIHAKAPNNDSFQLHFTFMRCNSRHHSLALFTLPYPKKLQHFMVEVEEIDDVGRSLYRAEAFDTHVSLTLGRHSNDDMLSVYYRTPSGFDVEYGWGGLEVDDETWHVLTHDAPSAWGHRFRPFDPEKA